MNDTKTTITTTVTSTEAIIIPASTVDQLIQQQQQQEQQQKPACSNTGAQGALENICTPNPPALPHFRKYRPASFTLRTRNWRTIPPGKRSEKLQWWEPELCNEQWKTTLIPNPPPLPSFPQKASKWNRRLRTRKWDFSSSELGWSGIDRLTFFTIVQQMEDRRFQWVRQCYLSEKSTLLPRNNGIPNPPPLPSFNLQPQQQQSRTHGKLHQKVHAELRKLRTKTWGRWSAHQQIQEIENRRYAVLKEMYLTEKAQNANIQFTASNITQGTSFSNASIQSVPATATYVAPIQPSVGPILTDTSNAGSSGYQQQQVDSTQGVRSYETTTVQQTTAPQYATSIPQYTSTVPQYTANKVPTQRASAPIPQSVLGNSNASYYDSSAPAQPTTIPGTLLTQPNDPAIVGQPSAINQNYAMGTLLPIPNQQAPIQQQQQQQQGQSVSFAPNLIQEPAPSYSQNQNYQTSQNGSKGKSNAFANMAKSMRKKKSQRPASQSLLYSTTTTQSNTVPVQSTPVSGYTAPTAVISPGSSISGAYQQQQQQQPFQSTQSTQPFQSTQPVSTSTYTTSSLSPTGTSSSTKKPGVLKFRGLVKEKIGHLTHNPKMEMEGKQLENQAVIAKQQQQLDRASTVTGNPTK